MSKSVCEICTLFEQVRFRLVLPGHLIRVDYILFVPHGMLPSTDQRQRHAFESRLLCRTENEYK